MPTLKEIAKTNLSHLKEILKGNDEGLEFLEAIEKDHKAAIEKLEYRKGQLKEKIKELECVIEIDEDVELCDSQIDFGVGLLQFKQPSNLKIQQVMENLTKEYQVNSNYSSLF